MRITSMQNLQSLGSASCMFGKDPRVISTGLKLAAAEKAAATGAPMQEPEPVLILDGLHYYDVADIVAAVEALARLDIEQARKANE